MQCRSVVIRINQLIAGLLALFALNRPAIANVEFDCVVQPSRTLAIGSPVTGILSEVIVERGDRVSRGQVLARLEAELETAIVELNTLRAADDTSIKAQRARLRLAQDRMVRSQKLFERGVTAEEAFDQATAELSVSEAELERLSVQQQLAALELQRAKAALVRRTIKSPIDGIVAARRLSPGEFVTQEAWIVQLADLDPLYVEVFLPTSYYDQLAVGQLAEVALRQPANTRLEAEVIVVDSVFDATSSTFGVRLALPNPEAVLPAGQRCKVSMEIEEVEQETGGLGLD